MPAGAADAQGVSKNEIVVGSIQDLSGPLAGFGKQVRLGMMLRVDEINEQGGINGRKLKLLVEDSGYDPKKAVLAAQKLVNQDKIFIMVGHIGTAQNNAAMPVQFEKNVINFFPVTAAREMYEPFHRLKYSFAATYYDQVRTTMPKLIKDKGAKKVCVIYQDDEFGLEVLRGGEAALKTMGMEFAEKTSYKRGATDFSSQVARMKSAGCDFVLLGTIIRETIGTIAEARKTGFAPTFLGTSASYTDLIHKLGGKAMDGLYATMTVQNPYLDEASKPISFWANKYKTKFSEDPTVFSIYGYNAIDAFARAAAKAGPNLSTDTFIKAMDSMSFEPDMFGSAPSNYTATKRLGSDAVAPVAAAGRPLEGRLGLHQAELSPWRVAASGDDVGRAAGGEQLAGGVGEFHPDGRDARAEAQHLGAQQEALAEGRAQVVDAQVDRAELAEAAQPLGRRLGHVARADRRHHGEAGHGVERRADDAAVQALVRVVADQVGPHRQMAADAVGGERVDAQAEDVVERNAFLEERGQAADELLFERGRGRRARWSWGRGVGKRLRRDVADCDDARASKEPRHGIASPRPPRFVVSPRSRRRAAPSRPSPPSAPIVVKKRTRAGQEVLLRGFAEFDAQCRLKHVPTHRRRPCADRRQRRDASGRRRHRPELGRRRPVRRERRCRGVQVFYVPAPGFVGTDRFALDVGYSAGRTVRADVEVEVR